MNFPLTALKSKPQALYMLDDTAPFQDYSGYARTGTTVSGTPGTSVSLARGAVYSQVFDRNVVGKFACPVFNQGQEDKAFSLETWLYPVGKTTGQTAQTYRENLALNPSFENNAQTNTGQMGSATTTQTVVNTGQLVGAFAQSTTINVKSGSYGRSWTIAPPYQTQETGTYSWACWVKPNRTLNFTAYGEMNRKDNGAYGGITPASNPLQNAPANAWTRLVIHNVPVTNVGNSLRFGFLCGDYQVGDVIMWDAGIIEAGPTVGSYFDGTLPGYEWSGTANASISRTRRDVSKINLFNDPDVEVGGWANQHGTTLLDSSIKVSGNQSISATRTQTGVGANRLGKFSSNAFIGGQGTIYVSVWVRSTAACNALLEIPLTNPVTGVTDWNASSNTSIPANTWVKLTHSTSAGVRSVFQGIQIVVTSGFPEGGTMWGDEWFASTSNTTFFSGNSPGAVFSGTANASQSLMLTSNSEQQVLSHLNAYDGLTANGNVISFATKYADGTEARASYDLQQAENVHVVGVHTAEKNTLFVDGLMVAEADISDTQQLSTFTATSPDLYSGTSLSSQAVAQNGVTIYDYALPAESIYENYLSGLVPDQVAEQSNANIIDVSINSAQVFVEHTWETSEDWLTGTLTNTTVLGDKLQPQYDGDTSLPGAWYDSVDIESANTTSIYGVNFNWDGKGAVVEASLDGTTWEVVQRGINISLIPNGYNPTNKVLQVRVSFPAATSADGYYIDHLNVVGFLTNTTVPDAGRTVTYVSAHPERDYPPLEFKDDWGVQVSAGGSITISADTMESLPARTIELWIKRMGDNPTFSATGTYYQNGAVATSTLDAGEWTLLHIVAGADITGSITINGPAQIGQVGVYDTALSAQQITDIYNAYVGKNSLPAPDSTTLTIGQDTNAAKIYAFDWAIQGAG